MTNGTDDPYTEWQEVTASALQQFAETAMKEYTERFLLLSESDEMSDEAFTAVIAAIVRLPDGDGVQWLSARTGFDQEHISAWLRCSSVPKAPQRKLTLALCVGEALEFVKEHTLSVLGRLVSFEQLGIASLAASREVLIRPVFTTPLNRMRGWDKLPSRVGNALRHYEILRFGDLLSRTELSLRRVSNFGKKSLNETNEWLALYGLAVPQSESQILPVLQHWDIYHRELPSPRDDRARPGFWDDWGMSKAVTEILYKNSVRTFGALAEKTEEELKELFEGNFASIAMVTTVLSKAGLSIGMTFPKWSELRP